MSDAIDDALSLEEKAEAMEGLLWERCRSPEGLLYCFIMADTLRRPSAADVAATAPDPNALTEADLRYGSETLEVTATTDGPQYLLQGIPLEDVEAYEDSVTATSLLLSALCSKYLATLDPAALHRAGELFVALEKVYVLGLEEQPGWIPKPYGFRCTRQSSMDNQCPFSIALLRYSALADPDTKQRVVRVLTDQTEYWIRNNYRMHVPYFGLWVDYAADHFYPGHWPLLFLPLLHGVWRLTGEDRYAAEYARLTGLLHDTDQEPEYLRQKIRCLHRWYYQYGALLEIGADPRLRWTDGLRAQVTAAAEEADLSSHAPDITHHAWVWLAPREEQSRQVVADRLAEQRLHDFLYRWPSGHQVIAPLSWRSRAIYTVLPASRLETFWRGRRRGDW